MTRMRLWAVSAVCLPNGDDWRLRAEGAGNFTAGRPPSTIEPAFYGAPSCRPQT